MAPDATTVRKALQQPRDRLNDKAVNYCCCSSLVLLQIMAVLACPSTRFPEATASHKYHESLTTSSNSPVRSIFSPNPSKPEDSGMRQQPSSSSSPKQKTAFQLAHPPPTVKHKQRLHIRPKLLLQLHETSLTSRPVPVLDVLPSTVFATRIARRFPKIFRGKNGLGPDDLIIARSPEYTAQQDGSEDSGHENLDSREVIAAICHPRKVVPGHGELDEMYFNDGSSWQALLMPSGIYQLTLCQGPNNIVARWVPRHSVARRQSLKAQGHSAAALPDDERFTFSLINPASRRHPVIASMTRHSIDVPSAYSDPFGSVPISPQSPGDDRNISDQASQRSGATMPMTEDLRALILVSGIWVAFREGFSPNFQYDSLGPSPPPTPNAKAYHESRSLTFAGSDNTSQPRHTRNLSDSRPPLRSPMDGRSSVPNTPTYDYQASMPSRRAFSSGNNSSSFPQYGASNGTSVSTGHFGNGLGTRTQMETWLEEEEDHKRRPSIFSHTSSKGQSTSSYEKASVTKAGKFKRMLGLGRRSNQER